MKDDESERHNQQEDRGHSCDCISVHLGEPFNHGTVRIVRTDTTRECRILHCGDICGLEVKESRSFKPTITDCGG